MGFDVGNLRGLLIKENRKTKTTAENLPKIMLKYGVKNQTNEQITL